jgi:putative transposase
VQLSSELFERIVGIAAPAQAAPAAGDVVSPAGSRVMDRRGATRIPFGARAKITYENPEQAGITETVMLQDISVQGISFVSADWIALEEVLVVYLKDQQDQELRLRCKVQRCEQGGYGGVSYVIGTNFLELVENAPGQSTSAAAPASSKKSASRKRRPSAPPAGISGRLKKLNPLRLFGSRNFDDFTAVGEGSKPSREVLEQQEAEEAEEAQAAEKLAEAGEENPSQVTIVATPTSSDPTTPRKSSIFLRAEKPQAPVEETATPQPQEQPELKEQPEVAAAVAPSPIVEELPPQNSPPAEAAESASISADDIASILNAIPMGNSPVSELPKTSQPLAEPVTVSEATKTPQIQPPAPIAEIAIPEPVAVTAPAPQPVVPAILEPVAISLPTPSLVTAANLEPVVIQSPPPAPAAPINPEPIVATVPTPQPPAILEPVKAELTALATPPVAIPVNVEPVAIKAPTPSPVISPEPVKMELPPPPVNLESVKIESPAISPVTAVSPEPVATKPSPAPIRTVPVESAPLSAADISAILNAIPVEKPLGSSQSSSQPSASELPTTTVQAVVSETPKAPQAVAVVPATPAIVAPPVVPVNVVPEPIQLPSPTPAALVKEIEAITPPTLVVVANPEPVAPPAKEEPATISSPSSVALEPEIVAIESSPAPVASGNAEPLQIEAAPLVNEELLSIEAMVPVDEETDVIETIESLPIPAAQADPEPMTIEAEVPVDEEPVVIEAVEPPPLSVASVELELATVELPELVDLSMEPIEEFPLEAPVIAESVAVATETAPSAEETPWPVDSADTEPLAVEESAPQPLPAALVEPEPITVELSAPSPVVSVDPEPVAFEAPAPESLPVEPVQVEPVIAKSVTPPPVVANNPEPVTIKESAAPSPTAVVAVNPKAVTIESPAPSIAAEKKIAAEVVAEEVAQETEEAEEVKETMKLEPAKSGTVKFNFTEKTLPSYLSNPDSIEDLVPWLSFKGVGTGDLPAALAHLGFDGSEATAMNVLQMKEVWAEEYRAWNRRDLRGKRYVYLWADGINIGSGPDGVLVIMGAGEKGERELVAVGAGQRENPDSWIALLADMKSRGLTRPPKLFIGDAKLGLWKPLTTLSPTTRQQRCWAHKSADVLKSLPKTLHPYAMAKLEEITMAARREQAIKPLDMFAQICQAESPEAAQCLLADKDMLLTFHDFPAEHWTHLRNTSAIGGIFDSLDLKNYSAEETFAREQAIMMAFKLAQSAQKHWRKLSGSPLLTDVLRGVAFIDGVKAAA